MYTDKSITIGVLSDTHISEADRSFQAQVDCAFSSCDTIIHAGDLTNQAVLEVFGDKRVYAVHGNMCNSATKSMLPDSRIFSIDDYTFGLCHGHGIGYGMEESLVARFSDVDCIIYGHTHHPLNHRFGSVLFVNPGSFRGTGRYGSPGTYALLTIDTEGLSAAIHSLPQEL